MNGRVSAREAIVSVVFRRSGRPDAAHAFIIDTGFSGALTLPVPVVMALELPFERQIVVSLADDSIVSINAHVATILWNGRERAVEVLATGARPLLGTLLLDGHALSIEFREGGAVAVAPL
jgi:clan AA aspartic protease